MEDKNNDYLEFKNQCNYNILSEVDKIKLDKVYKKSLEIYNSKIIKYKKM